MPERERILVDGVDFVQVDSAWLRRQVGVVLQENFLFNRSVHENIVLTDPGLAMEQVMQAAKLAGAQGLHHRPSTEYGPAGSSDLRGGKG